jgi:hypothetical protein
MNQTPSMTFGNCCSPFNCRKVLEIAPQVDQFGMDRKHGARFAAFHAFDLGLAMPVPLGLDQGVRVIAITLVYLHALRNWAVGGS